MAWPGCSAAGDRRRLPGRALRALLHVAARSGARFFAFFLAFMGSMLGVVLSGNLFQLVFFWELTSVFSFLLIGYWHHNPAARDGARMALIITSAGGLCLFAGVLLLGRIAGSYDLDAVLLAGDRIRGAFAVSAGTAAGGRRGPDQVGAVSVPLLVAAGDGGADAGVGLPSLGGDGQAGRVPADPAVAGIGGHRSVDVGDRQRGTGNTGLRRLCRDFPARPERPAGVFDREPSRPGDRAARTEQPAALVAAVFQ